MAKKKAVKPQREFIKHQLTRWEQQKRRQRIIFISGIAIIVAALLTVGAGWYFSEFRPLRETVIKVNNTEFNMNYFITMLKVYGKGQDINYMYALANQMPIIIERNELIKEGASKLGITVSDDEIKAELSKNKLDNDSWDLVRTDLLAKKLQDEYFDRQVPTSAEQRQVMAIFLESESQANLIRARLEKGEDFITLAKELSLDANSKDKGGDFGWHPQGILTGLLGTSVPDDYAFGSEKGVLSQPRYDENKVKSLGYWLIKVLERKQEPKEVHVQAMLLSSAEQVQNIKARLDKGEDFAALAKEFSQTTTASENGGDLGWIASGATTKAIDDYAFNDKTELGKLSEPIRDDSVNTKGGYWLIKILDIDSNRDISDEDRNTLKNKALNEWIASLFADQTNIIDDSLLTTDKITFAVNKAIGG